MITTLGITVIEFGYTDYAEIVNSAELFYVPIAERIKAKCFKHRRKQGTKKESWTLDVPHQVHTMRLRFHAAATGDCTGKGDGLTWNGWRYAYALPLASRRNYL